MIIDFKCEVKKGKSEKTGKPYYQLIICELGKSVFLSDTEAKLLSFLHPYSPSETSVEENE